MRGRQMITTRAHRHQASPNLLVCLRSRSVPLGTVEIRCLQHRLPGRYRPFPPNFALFANWLSVPHAGVGTPPHANFIVNYPIFFMKPFIPCECYVHGEFGVLPMFVSLVLVFPPSKVCIATLRCRNIYQMPPYYLNLSRKISHHMRFWRKTINSSTRSGWNFDILNAQMMPFSYPEHLRSSGVDETARNGGPPRTHTPDAESRDFPNMRR